MRRRQNKQRKILARYTSGDETFGEDVRFYEGVDGYRSTLHPQEAWAIYHLLRGGFTRKPTIEYVVGLRPGTLNDVDLDRLFLSCDNSYGYTSKRPAKVAVRVRCSNCLQYSEKVPCQWCDRPAAWVLGDPLVDADDTVWGTYLAAAAATYRDVQSACCRVVRHELTTEGV